MLEESAFFSSLLVSLNISCNFLSDVDYVPEKQVLLQNTQYKKKI